MDLALLKQAAIFADLDEGELARVAEVCKEQKLQSAATVFKEGEPSNRLYIIAEGEVRISRIVPGSGEEALAVLKPGTCFGEMRAWVPAGTGPLMTPSFARRSVWRSIFCLWP